MDEDSEGRFLSPRLGQRSWTGVAACRTFKWQKIHILVQGEGHWLHKRDGC